MVLKVAIVGVEGHVFRDKLEFLSLNVPVRRTLDILNDVISALSLRVSFEREYRVN